MPKILLIHSGHSFSTSDVYDGLLWGFGDAGAEVIEYRWDRSQQTLSMLAHAAVAQNQISADRASGWLTAAGRLAASDAVVQALVNEVDAVVVVNGLLFPPGHAQLLRDMGMPIACYGTEAPYMETAERAIAGAYSHWFTQERKSVERYADLVPTTYLPLAYHPERHTRSGPIDPDKAVDAVFVGGGYPERKALLDGVNWSGLSHARIGTLWDLDLEAMKAAGATPGSHSATYSAGSVPNDVTTAWHRSARIVLNAHRRMTFVETLDSISADEAESCNPRCYEVPALRSSLLLCDDSRPEYFDLFGDCASTYRYGDSADLERQIRYWLAHPDARESTIAAQYAAIQPHHYGARARAILTTLIP